MKTYDIPLFFPMQIMCLIVGFVALFFEGNWLYFSNGVLIGETIAILGMMITIMYKDYKERQNVSVMK